MAPAVLEHPEARPEPAKEVPTMQGYASPERLASSGQPRSLPEPLALLPTAAAIADADAGVSKGLLVCFAELVADRVLERIAASSTRADEWLDTRAAAEYLGVHRDTLRKLAAERAIPTHQDAPGCKLYFRRDELDEWRRATPSKRTVTRLRAVS